MNFRLSRSLALTIIVAFPCAAQSPIPAPSASHSYGSALRAPEASSPAAPTPGGPGAVSAGAASSQSSANAQGAGGTANSSSGSGASNCPCDPGAYTLAPTRVYSDENGIPHIVSLNDEGAAYALGLEHFWRYPITTAYLLRYSSGKLSSIIGPEALGRDKLIHMWRLEEVSKSHLPPIAAGTTPPNWRLLLCAYTRGLNHGRQLWDTPGGHQYLANNTQPVSLPDAAAVERMLDEPIEDWMVIAWSFAFQGQFVFQTNNGSMAIEAESSALNDTPNSFGNEATDYNPLAFNTPGGPDVCDSTIGASNAWAVSGAGSSSGGPILASDPHLPCEGDCDSFRLPRPIWRPAYHTMHSPEEAADPLNLKPHKPELDWAGWTVPGIFMGGIGGNKKVAYGIVSNITNTNHIFWTMGDLNVTNPSISWGGNTYSPAKTTVAINVWDGTTVVPEFFDIWWLDGVSRRIPIYLAASAPGVTGASAPQRIYWSVAHFASSPMTPFEYMYKKAISQSMEELDEVMSTQTQSFGADLAISTQYERDEGGSGNALGYWYTGQSLDRGPNPTTGIPDPITVIEPASATNEISPLNIYPMSQRPHGIAPDSAGYERLWITTNSPPDDVAPSVPALSTPSMLDLCDNNWYILPQRSVPPYAKAPLAPTPYRHRRVKEDLGADVLSGAMTATQADVMSWMVDIQDIRAVRLRDYWSYVLMVLDAGDPNYDLPAWLPAGSNFSDASLYRNAINAWLNLNDGLAFSLPDASIPSSGSSATAAGYMAIIDGAMRYLIGGSPGAASYGDVSDTPDNWLTIPTDAYVPNLADFQNSVANWNLPGWPVTDLDKQVRLMVFGIIILDASLNGPTVGDSWINGKYWASQVPFDISSAPGTWSLPWDLNVQGLPMHLPTDEWNLSAGLPANNELYWGHMFCLDWGATDFVGLSLNNNPKQYILPVAGATSGLFAQGLGARTIGVVNPWLPGNADPRFPNNIINQYQPQTYSNGVFHEQRYVGGSRSLTCIELDPSGGQASVRFSVAIGATELYSEARRYKTAKAFSDRTFLELRTDWQNWATLPPNWQFYDL